MILDEILATKRDEVAAARRRYDEDALRASEGYGEPRRGFTRALRAAKGPAVIAEIKRASPSKGVLRADFDPALHARQYAGAGATCLSVLTDQKYFQGSLEYLRAVRGACELPLLRKDFTIDPYQIVEARAWGADAVLLIVAALDSERIRDLTALAADEQLDVLVEVHDRAELEIAIACGARLVGINNRDLRTFKTSLDTTRNLAPLVPRETTLVSESGLQTRAQLEELAALGVGAFLIGEHFMRADDPGTALAELTMVSTGG